MIATRPPRIGSDAGFVIIGAVMFVLALTILGLSLFGLSSYEAQFLARSTSELQALYDAQGGIERARYALAVAPHHLEQVASNLSPNVVSAQAIQYLASGDSIETGAFKLKSEGGEAIVVRVTAQHGNVTRTLESAFDPEAIDDYYRRAITVADSMYVNDRSGVSNTNRCETVIVTGGIRIGAISSPGDTSWVDCLLDYNPHEIEIEALPGPDVDAFFAEHPLTPVPAKPVNGSTVTFRFSGDPSSVTFWHSNPGGGDFDFFENRSTTLDVTGHNVWMVADGMRFDGDVDVVGDPATASLVIVVGRNGRYTYNNGTSIEDYRDVGIWFFAGVESQIPLILVSDGGAYIEQFQHTNLLTQDLPYLSVYAGHAFITGPQQSAVPPARLYLTYEPFVMNDRIDFLSNLGALPNASAHSGTQFALIPGSWREIGSN